MSQTIDERVVEMRFDNKQFESGVKETTNSLSRLKEALKMHDATKGFENLDKAAKNVSLDGIAAGIEALQQRFSTFGIVGMRIIENLTDAITGKFKTAIGFVTDSIISGGQRRAMNIENAHFQLQALLKDEERVQAVMADAMTSVDGTAYAYDEAAKAAAQFAASGLQAGDEMLSALRGIVGVAAMTNSEYEGISRIFTTTAGNGRIMGDQLLQLSSRGLNAASTMAEYFNKVNSGAVEATDSVREEIEALSYGMEVTEEFIRSTISDPHSNISFAVFSAAMTDAFAESAERANETFTGAFSNMKSALARIGAEFYSPLIEQNSDLIGLFNVLRVQINAVKKGLAYDTKASALSGLAAQTGRTEEAFSNLFDTISERGNVALTDIGVFSNAGVPIVDKLMKYLNGVSDGSIRATYATKTAITELTNGTELLSRDVIQMINDGKITTDMFVKSMDEAYGNQRSLAKDFTTWFLDNVKYLSAKIQNIDMSTPLDIFYSGVNSGKNAISGLLSVLKPLGGAFSDVFLNFSAGDVLNIAKAFENLTSRIHLSEKGSDDLRRASKGLFSVFKLGIDVLIKFVRAFIPIEIPVNALRTSFLDCAGNLGDLLSGFSDWVRQSPNIKKSYDLVSSGISGFMGFLGKAITKFYDFGKSTASLPGVQKVLESFGKVLNKFGEVVGPYLDKAAIGLENFKKEAKDIIPEKANAALEMFAKGLDYLATKIAEVDLSFISNGFKDLMKTAEEFFRGLKKSASSISFFDDFGQGFFSLESAFGMLGIEMNESVEGKTGLGGVKEKFLEFQKWIKEKIGPMFEGMNFGSLASVFTGIASIVATLKMSKDINKAAETFGLIPKKFAMLADSLKETMLAYQRDLNADALKKVATAILILAAAVAVLSLLDVEKVLAVSAALAGLSYVLLNAVNKLAGTLKAAKTANDALFAFASKIGKAFNKMALGISVKLIATTVKDIAKAVFLIVGLIAGIAYMFKSGKIDKASVQQSLDLVEQVGSVVIVMVGIMGLVGAAISRGSKSIAFASSGILMFSLAVGVMVLALNKLFKMKFPNDWGEKIFVLGSIFVGMAMLSVVAGKANKQTGSKIDLNPMLSMAASMYIMVLALNKLFKMELPSDVGPKLLIFGAMILGVSALTLAIGKASKGANSALKASGTIVALSAFLVAMVSQLEKLAKIDTSKLISGVASISVILLSLGASFKIMGSVDSSKAAKSITAITLMLGVLTAALGALSFIPGPQLLKSAIILGLVLAALALDLKSVSVIGENKSIMTTMFSLVAVILILSDILTVLAKVPFKDSLAAATSLSLVMTSLAGTIKMLSGQTKVNPANILAFGAASMLLIPIASSIKMLANGIASWESVAAAGIAFGTTTIALAGVMKVLSTTGDIKPAKIAEFGAATIALFPIAYALKELADQNPLMLIASATALSEVLLAISVSFGIIAKTNPNLVALGSFLAATAGLMLISTSIGMLADYNWQSLIGAASALSITMLGMSAALAVCSLIGPVASGAILGMLALDAFLANLVGVIHLMSNLDPTMIEKGSGVLTQIGKALGDFLGSILGSFIEKTMEGVSESLERFGTSLSNFYTNAKPFFEGMGNIKPEVFNGTKLLAQTLMLLLASDLLNGIMTWGYGSSDDLFTKFGEQLAELGPSIKQFSDDVEGIKPSSVKAAATATAMMAEVANKLPYDKETLFGAFIGKISLAEFGSWLISKDKNGLGFGEAISKFAQQVKDVKSQDVEGAAAATELMAEVANKLPYDKASLMGKLFGKISLAEFGDQLIGKGVEGKGFGEAITEFAQQVKDVKESHVKGAAAAATLISEVANNLNYDPESLMGKLFGRKSLADFANELKAFGPSLQGFVGYVSGITEGDVQGAVNAANVLVAMANNLPDSESWIKKIFYGEQKTLAVFGEELVLFGGSLVNFATDVGTIDYAKLNAISTSISLLSVSITTLTQSFMSYGELIRNMDLSNFQAVLDEFQRLASLIELMNKMKIEDLTEKFTNLGNIGLTGFMDAVTSALKNSIPNISGVATSVGVTICSGIQLGIDDRSPSVKLKITDLCTFLVNKAKEILKFTTFSTITQNALSGISTGISLKKNGLISDMETLCSGIVSTASATLSVVIFTSIGSSVSGIGVGISNQTESIRTSATNLSSVIVSTFQSILTLETFKTIGVNVGSGLQIGIESKVVDITNSVNSIANAAVNAAKDTLEIHSPSKVSHAIGENFDLGLIGGILSRVSDVTNASEITAQNVINPIREAVSSINSVLASGELEDHKFTITPVLDLSSIKAGATEISGILDRRLDLSTTFSRANDISGIMGGIRESKYAPQKETKVSSGSTVYNFNQYNQSPKALSQAEIYRQTNNQFSAFKRAVERK